MVLTDEPYPCGNSSIETTTEQSEFVCFYKRWSRFRGSLISTVIADENVRGRYNVRSVDSSSC